MLKQSEVRSSRGARRFGARLCAFLLAIGGLGTVGVALTATPAAAAANCGPFVYWYVSSYINVGEACGLVGVAPSTMTYTLYYSQGCEAGPTPNQMRTAWG